MKAYPKHPAYNLSLIEEQQASPFQRRLLTYRVNSLMGHQLHLNTLLENTTSLGSYSLY